MYQVLFYLPLHSLSDSLPDIPVYGYGMMLFIAFVLCSWLAGRLARREGIDPNVIPDLAIWLFVGGILGARINAVLQDWHSFFGEDKNPLRIFALWDGGLVLYGSLIGGAIAYFLAYRWLLAPAKVSNWKMADILAPCIALGVCLGRVGCLLTGCCFGNVACADCASISFPLPSYPTHTMTQLGYQTLAGFMVRVGDLEVSAVEPGSPAEAAGLQSGDSIVSVNGQDVSHDKQVKEGIETRYLQLLAHLRGPWPAGVHQLQLGVRRDGQNVQLPAFLPVSLPLHPTQIYETISMGLLLFLLLSYYPFKKHDGSVLVLLMVGYGLHRFLNEMLRVDNPPLVLGLNEPQLVSMSILLGAGVLAYFVFVRRAGTSPTPTPAVNTW
jgi:phosphatidylglycerol:prolipoprotein diacylglycerol transferase